MADLYPFVHECKPAPFAVQEWASNDTGSPPPSGTPLTVRCIVCGRVMWQLPENANG